MGLPVTECKAALVALEPGPRFEMYRIHIDRWLNQNRGRLSRDQVAYVTEMRDLLTPDGVDSKRMVELTDRMRCEFWKSDAMALGLPQTDRLASSRIGDVTYWFRNCVIDKLL